MHPPEYHSFRKDISSVSSYRQLILPKDEYAYVMHELNTHLSEKDKQRKLVTKPIGNYYYTFLNKGFNDYIIIGKREIIPDVEDNFL